MSELSYIQGQGHVGLNHISDYKITCPLGVAR